MKAVSVIAKGEHCKGHKEKPQRHRIVSAKAQRETYSKDIKNTSLEELQNYYLR